MKGCSWSILFIAIVLGCSNQENLNDHLHNQVHGDSGSKVLNGVALQQQSASLGTGMARFRILDFEKSKLCHYYRVVAYTLEETTNVAQLVENCSSSPPRQNN